MSSRWFTRSAFFNRSPSFFSETRTTTTEMRKAAEVLRTRNSLPILCWLEKFILLIDYFQIFDLLWICAQPWPWPYLWTIKTRPLLYINLDFFSLTPDGALAGKSSSISTPRWGKMDGYLLYAFIFAIVQFGVFFSAPLYKKYLDRYSLPITRFYHQFTFLTLLISTLIYLPCCLAVFRLYYCNGDNNLSADPTVECFGVDHSIYFAICTALMLPVLIGLPLVTYRHVFNSTVYQDATDHDKRLQMWELLYMLDLDDYWLNHQVWLASSFRLSGAYFRLHLLILKIVLLCIFIFVRNSMILQSFLFCFVVCCFGLYYTAIRYPFRCVSTNIIMVCVLCMLIINATFGMVNSFGVKSAVMTASTETIVLGACNVFFLAVIAVIYVYTALQNDLDWPSVKTLNRILKHSDLAPKVAQWVETIRESYLIKVDFIKAPVEIADINSLEESIRQLRSCWLSARSVGSIFETPLSDVLEDMLLTHATALPKALRKFECWNSAYEEGVKNGVFAHRARQYKLMAPKKRRILLKLLALRLVTNNKFSFDMDFAMKYQLEQEKSRRRQERRSQKLKAKSRKFHFQSFAMNAKTFLLTGKIISKEMPTDLSASGDEFDLESNHHSSTPSGDPEHKGSLGDFDRDATDGEEQEEDEDELQGLDRFSAEEVEEATEMVRKLHTRTELALNKHHNAKKNLHAMNIANAANMTQSSHGLMNKISTMDLIKDTVDVEERKDLEELYLLWDWAIRLYEIQEFPGDYELLDKDAENWYTYRGLVSERLEIVVNTLEQNIFDGEMIDAQVIEEGLDEEDDESGRASRKGVSARGGGAGMHSDEDEKSDEEEDERRELLKSNKRNALSRAFQESQKSKEG